MSEYLSVRCPKCGYFSDDRDVCNACGAVFAKVWSREDRDSNDIFDPGGIFSEISELPTPSPFAGEQGTESGRVGQSSERRPKRRGEPQRDSYASVEESLKTSWSRLIIAIVVVVILAGGAWLLIEVTPRNKSESVIQRHRALVEKVRSMFASEQITSDKVAVALGRFRARANELARQVNQLPASGANAGGDDLKRKALIEANQALYKVLSMPADDLMVKFREAIDPLDAVEEKLSIAENPELRPPAVASSSVTGESDQAAGESAAGEHSGSRTGDSAAVSGETQAAGKASAHSAAKAATAPGKKGGSELTDKVLSYFSNVAPEVKEAADPNIRTVSDATFRREVIDSGDVFLVEFWAPWSVPSRQMAPLVRDLAKEYRGRLKVARVNVDENPKLVDQFSISTLPIFAVMKDGKVKRKLRGIVSRDLMRKAVDPIL